MELHIVSAYRGASQFLGWSRRGARVYSAVRRASVSDSRVYASREGLEGDQPADRRVHGGPDQAICAYPLEHVAFLAKEFGMDLRPGDFGENLSVAGATESEIRIGDVFAAGDVRLRVTKARRPCSKLTVHFGSSDIPTAMAQMGLTGWYFAVDKPGDLSIGATLTRVVSSDGLTVLAAFTQKNRQKPISLE